jgi:uncharacterized Tic20 family protein
VVRSSAASDVYKRQGIIMVPVIAILLFILLKAAEFFLIIYASVKTSHGEYFDYPLTFKFIK